MRYILIGNGRVSKHLAYYLEQKNLPYSNWHYKDNITLEDFLTKQKQIYNLTNDQLRVFILIKDSAIEQLYLNHPCLNKIEHIFHCSGALSIDNIITLHPLMTFSDNLFDLDTYEALSFVTDQNNINKPNLLPGLCNKIFYIPKDKQAYYHALCVCIGNFAQILWQEATRELSDKLDIPRDIANLYITNITQNFITNPKGCLTGPLARDDKETIMKNISALEINNSLLLDTYRNFCELYNKKLYKND